MRKYLVAAIPFLFIACTPSAGPTRLLHPAAPASVQPGPSAAQLTRGQWFAMAVPPIRLCQPAAVWDGRALIVVESGGAPCHPAAAAYDPRANRWVGVAAPPRAIGLNPIFAWGGGRLAVVSPRTGFAEDDAVQEMARSMRQNGHP